MVFVFVFVFEVDVFVTGLDPQVIVEKEVLVKYSRGVCEWLRFEIKSKEEEDVEEGADNNGALDVIAVELCIKVELTLVLEIKLLSLVVVLIEVGESDKIEERIGSGCCDVSVVAIVLGW